MPRQQFNEHILRLARSLRLTAYDEVLGDYPIHAAILRGEYSLIDRLLLNYGVDLNTTGRTGSTPLHLALDFAQARDQDRMLQLLFRGSVYEGTPPLDLNLLSPLGNTVLHRIAAHLGTAERVKTLRSLFHSYHRLDINGEDREGHTALHLAARNFTSDHADEEQHQLEAIDLLLRQGADPNRRVHGLSALDFAAAGNHWSLARLLLQHGASPVKYKRGGWTLKHHLKYLRMRARKEFVAVGGNPIVFVTRRD